MPELTLSKQALIKLLERASPDPCEPYGCDPSEPPGEPPEPPPWEFPRLLRLNPQPLPPRGHWRPVTAARMTIARMLALHESAELIGGDGGRRATGMIERRVTELVDDWCGTRPHPRPFPWPWGPILRGSEELQPIDLIVAGAQFQKAAETLEGCALRKSFEEAAERLLTTGVSRLEEADETSHLATS